MQDLLDLVRKLVRTESTVFIKPRAITAKGGTFVIFCRKHLFLNPVDFKPEEQRQAGNAGHFFLNGLVELANRRVRAITCIQQLRERSDPATDFADGFIFGNCGGKFIPRKTGKLALIVFLEGVRAGFGIIKITPDGRVFGIVIEIGQIPGRQILVGRVHLSSRQSIMSSCLLHSGPKHPCPDICWPGGLRQCRSQLCLCAHIKRGEFQYRQ